MAKRRLRECVELWPDCYEGGYDPHCCRFPKSCSCTVYDEDRVTEAELEPRVQEHKSGLLMGPTDVGSRADQESG